MHQAATACSTLENVDVECTHCGVRMTSHVGSGRQIRYFHCPSCSRWTTSVYSEVFRADTKMRTRRPGETETRSTGSVKERLENWLQAIAVSDPYRTLGLSPSASDQSLRERYLSLARTHHPDRGGAPEQMRKINDAYERVLASREKRRAEARVVALPVGSR
ncbi:MAG TPA: DnaJ domain-containing protein [Archangium sp.]